MGKIKISDLITKSQSREEVLHLVSLKTNTSIEMWSMVIDTIVNFIVKETPNGTLTYNPIAKKVIIDLAAVMVFTNIEIDNFNDYSIYDFLSDFNIINQVKESPETIDKYNQFKQLCEECINQALEEENSLSSIVSKGLFDIKLEVQKGIANFLGNIDMDFIKEILIDKDTNE